MWEDPPGYSQYPGGSQYVPAYGLRKLKTFFFCLLLFLGINFQIMNERIKKIEK